MEKLKNLKSYPRAILIVTLAVNLILTVVNLYIAFQLNQTLTSLGLHDRSFDSIFTITAKAEKIIFEKPAAYIMEDGVLKYTIHFGTLNVHAHVIMPHYGVVSIKLKSFNVTRSKYLNLDRLSEIEVSFADETQGCVYVLAPGLNHVDSQIRLKAKIPLNSEILPREGESIQFQLGYLFLEAEAFDFETRNKVNGEFFSEIFVTIESII